MKVNGPTGTGTTATTTRTGGSRPARSESTGSGPDEVKLSPASADLATGSEPLVDAAKVQEIRQAITEGRFQINAGAIADRLISTAQELVNSQRKA